MILNQLSGSTAPRRVESGMMHVDIVEVHRVALYGCGCGTVLTAGIGVGARDNY